MDESKEIVKSSIVMPAVSTDEAVKAWHAYQDLANKITTEDDTQYIVGKLFKKKSFWRKCQRFFNLSMELISEERQAIGDKFIYKFVYRSIAPNGAFCDGTGTCSSDEKGLLKTEHNTRAIAETRAKNRAISDLVAFGEVSAEEMMQSENGKSKDEIKQDKPKRGEVISDAQRKRLFAISKEGEVSEEQVKEICAKYGYYSTKEIKKTDYEKIVKEVEEFPKQAELDEIL